MCSGSLAEIAIIATDIAEVIGTAIGLNLLFGIPLEIGVIITALDVFLILYLQKLGFRWVEAFIITLLGVIAVCFAIQIASPTRTWGGVIRGFAPTDEIVRNPEHALSGARHHRRDRDAAQSLPAFRHRADPRLRRHAAEKREALKFATIDSTVALMFALLINASILILAAATFHKVGHTEIAELGEAHALLAPLLGAAIAPTLFGIALLCCGINSTVTATLAGQIVMEGFLKIKLPPWLRRLITRAIAIIPAAGVTIWYGDEGTARLLILTQVVLSLQLSFAVFPLVLFTASKAKMGELVAPRWLTAVAVLIAVVIAGLNVKLLVDFVLG
jgi:manganese transport protein